MGICRVLVANLLWLLGTRLWTLYLDHVLDALLLVLAVPPGGARSAIAMPRRGTNSFSTSTGLSGSLLCTLHLCILTPCVLSSLTGLAWTALSGLGRLAVSDTLGLTTKSPRGSPGTRRACSGNTLCWFLVLRCPGPCRVHHCPLHSHMSS